MSLLTSARYGKDKVRVFRVVREGNRHHVVEYNVSAHLEGELDDSYTRADNSIVVATDSIKNMIYYLAKTSPHVLCAELFAVHVGKHLLAKYAHLRKAIVAIEQLRWTRLSVEQGGHDHAFMRDGEEKRVVHVEMTSVRGEASFTAHLTTGMSDLLVLKTTGSAFEGFIRDEFTTLKPVHDRIFSTLIEVCFEFLPITILDPFESDDVRMEAGVKEVLLKGGLCERVRRTTLEVFATESASVQATLYKMADKVLEENGCLEAVSYVLPNKHYVPVDMTYIGVENTERDEAEVFVPLSAPRQGVSLYGTDMAEAIIEQWHDKRQGGTQKELKNR